MMADRESRMVYHLRVDLTIAYSQLAMVCNRLPIPVDLPTQEGVTLQNEMIPAVRRLIEIVNDQPGEEEVIAGTFMTAVDWLTAVELWTLLVSANESQIETRAVCCASALMRAREGLLELLREGDPEYGSDTE